MSMQTIMTSRFKRWSMILGGTFAALALIFANGAVTNADVSGPISSSVTSTAGTDPSTQAVITWTSDEPSTSQIAYGTTEGMYISTTTQDSTMMTNHSVTLSNLSPNTLYHYRIVSSNASSTTSFGTNNTFTTAATTPPATTTPATTTPSTDITMLQNQISALQNRILTLEAQVVLLISNQNNNGNGGTTTPVSGTAMISPGTATMSQNQSIDFNGRGFGAEENVIAMVNGTTIGTFHADGGGNFSTGSMSIPGMTGAQTVTFTGQNSGRVGTASITFQ
jgi:hypothetical protein